MEQCEVCGFDFAALDRNHVRQRVSAAATRIESLVESLPGIAQQRPSADRWSNTEYAGHVRDVFLTIHDRLVLGLIEDEPRFQYLYRDERADMGLLGADTAAAVLPELHAAATMFTRLFDALEPEMLGRMVRYGNPDPVPR